jgi:hypothetical protein
MSSRAKYKVGDIIEFTFAGSIHSGKILEVRKDTNKISYKVEDTFYTYPVVEDKITKKL